MRRMSLRKLLIGSVVGSCSLGLAVASLAQTAPATPDNGASTPAAPSKSLEEVTVTARKKAESLQDVPLSVTAITKKDLVNTHVENLGDVVNQTPGVILQDVGSEFGSSISIRGVTDLSFGAAVPATASFYDGVYLRDPQVINLSGATLDRVEIVKGPVSALYGRDAYAGVVNYVPQRPGNTPQYDLTQTFGTHGDYETNVSLSAPLVPDKVFLKIFGSYDTFDGSDFDKVSKQPGGAYDKKDFGSLLDIHYNDHITTQFDGYYGYDQFGQSDIVAIAPNCGEDPGYGLDQYCGTAGTKGSSFHTADNPGAGGTGNTRRVLLGSMHNIFDYDWGKIDSITAASRVNEENFADFDLATNGIPFALSNGTTINEHNYYGSASTTANLSEELRYSSPQDQRLRYGAGAYAYRENRLFSSAAGLSTIGIPAGVTFADPLLYTWATPYGEIGPNYNLSSITTTEKAGFANGEFDILPNLTFATQYRYTVLDQSFAELKNQYSAPLGSRLDSTEQYSNINTSLRYKVTPNVMAYASAANGEKPGGFNGAATVAADDAFGPETDRSYEIGVKTNWLGNSLQADLALFHIDTRNVQDYGPSSDPTNAAYVIKNFGATSNNGAELNLRAKPILNTVVTFGASYMDPTFNSGSLDIADAYNCFAVPSCAKKIVYTKAGLPAIPTGGNIVPYAPRVTLTTSAEYDYTLMDKYDGYARVDYTFRSLEYTDPSDLTSLGGRSLVDLSAGLSYGPYSLSAFVKNITDDRTPTFFNYQTVLNDFHKVDGILLPTGRVIGFTLGAHF